MSVVLISGDSLTKFTFSFTLEIMAKPGRPPKPKDTLLNAILRVMLTGEQRELVRQAATLDGEDDSAWARRIVVETAKRRISKKS